ncbi:hypothetical protein AWC38_SpisGene10495 [Stylophora pistillata]|uniref:SWIM-type domain-containing protein n=1 Tax=Stylophora pistillata TaxID=50429 RepID=A0A2B4S8K4_STYPI|nr:hypothetical protein AWC38_SpisGene10495 [Stylophora pistillata]
MLSAKSLPEAAFFSAEEKVQLLSGSFPRNLTKERLKEWLSFRKGTAKDGSARSEATKAELSQRVISYIKNSWENNFTEKWQHLAASKPEDQTATVNCDFPESAQWVSLVDAKDDVTSFNIQNIVSYFIERKAKDNDSKKDYKNVSSKAFGNNTFASCACPAGKGPRGSCKHIGALCYALEEFVRLECTREFETCTSRLQSRNQPRKRKLDSQSVYEIDFSKKIYRREERINVKPLNDPRRPSERNNDSKKVNRELLDKIKIVKPNCGFFCLLSELQRQMNLIFFTPSMPKNPPFPYVNHDEFLLDNLSDEEYIAEFRVEKSDLSTLADAPGIPPVFRCSQRSVFDGMESLCMLLRRLAYPCR